MCRLSKNLGALISWSPKGLSRPVMGLLYLFIIIRILQVEHHGRTDVLYNIHGPTFCGCNMFWYSYQNSVGLNMWLACNCFTMVLSPHMEPKWAIFTCQLHIVAFPLFLYIFATGLFTRRMPVNESMRRFKLINNWCRILASRHVCTVKRNFDPIHAVVQYCYNINSTVYLATCTQHCCVYYIGDSVFSSRQ
jgi:hypothetical protein